MSVSKFKVGDRVRVLAGIPWVSWLHKDAVLRVAGIRQDWVHGQQIKVEGHENYGWFHHSHFVAAPAGPIRTVTRREIVPGEYGGIEIFDDGSVILRDWTDAEACREAAHIFNQIAEVLEENAKEAA